MLGDFSIIAESIWKLLYVLNRKLKICQLTGQNIVRNKLAYLAVVKAHHMARTMLSISKDVQDSIERATAAQVSDLIRSTDNVDQVRMNRNTWLSL